MEIFFIKLDLEGLILEQALNLNNKIKQIEKWINKQFSLILLSKLFKTK